MTEPPAPAEFANEVGTFWRVLMEACGMDSDQATDLARTYVTGRLLRETVANGIEMITTHSTDGDEPWRPKE